MNEYLQKSMNAYLQIICSELKGIKVAIQSLTPDLEEVLKKEMKKPDVIEYQTIPEASAEHPCDECGKEIEDWVKWKHLCKRCYALQKEKEGK